MDVCGRCMHFGRSYIFTPSQIIMKYLWKLFLVSQSGTLSDRCRLIRYNLVICSVSDTHVCSYLLHVLMERFCLSQSCKCVFADVADVVNRGVATISDLTHEHLWMRYNRNLIVYCAVLYLCLILSKKTNSNEQTIEETTPSLSIILLKAAVLTWTVQKGARGLWVTVLKEIST